MFVLFVLDLSLGRRCLWSPGSSPRARSFNTLGESEVGGGGGGDGGGGGNGCEGRQRPEGEKRQLSRANPTDSRNTIPPLVGGLRMVCSHDRNQPGRRRAKSERKRGSPALADTEWNRDRLKCSGDDNGGGGVVAATPGNSIVSKYIHG